MTSAIDEVLAWGWSHHDSKTDEVATRLEGSVASVGNADDGAKLVQLGNHTLGQHAGDWKRAERLASSVMAKVGESQASAGLWVQIAVVRLLAGDEKGSRAAQDRAGALAPAERPGVDAKLGMFAAEALVASDRVEEGIARYRAALAGAKALPRGNGAERAVAMTSNNLASALRERTTRSEAETEAMWEAANASREFWLRIGDWTNDERSDYLLALISNDLERYGDAVLYAERGLTTIEKGGEEPVDQAFLSLALSAGYAGLGIPSAAKQALDDADRLAAAFPEQGLKDWFSAERAKVLTPA